MNTLMFDVMFGDMLKDLAITLPAAGAVKSGVRTTVPGIKKVIFNEPATIVYFDDGTKVMLKTSEHDSFNPELGIVYAIAKRAYGKVMPDGTVESNGFMQVIRKAMASGFDQKAHRAELNKKAKAKADKKANKPAAVQAETAEAPVEPVKPARKLTRVEMMFGPGATLDNLTADEWKQYKAEANRRYRAKKSGK